MTERINLENLENEILEFQRVIMDVSDLVAKIHGANEKTIQHEEALAGHANHINQIDEKIVSIEKVLAGHENHINQIDEKIVSIEKVFTTIREKFKSVSSEIQIVDNKNSELQVKLELLMGKCKKNVIAQIIIAVLAAAGIGISFIV